MSEKQKDEIKEKIDRMFGDRSVSAETTADHLKEIISHCKDSLQALREDGVQF